MKIGNRRKVLGIATVIIVVAVIAALALIKVPVWTSDGLESRVRADLRAIVDAAEMFHMATGRYPASLGELTSPLAEAGNEPLLESTIDRWSRPYIYRLVGGKPRVSCLGRDGLPGGTGLDRDLEYHKPDEEN